MRSADADRCCDNRWLHHEVDEDRYFLGSLVVARSPEGDRVLDGQQRLTTLSLLIAVLRDRAAGGRAAGQPAPGDRRVAGPDVARRVARDDVPNEFNGHPVARSACFDPRSPLRGGCRASSYAERYHPVRVSGTRSPPPEASPGVHPLG